MTEQYDSPQDFGNNLPQTPSSQGQNKQIPSKDPTKPPTLEDYQKVFEEPSGVQKGLDKAAQSASFGFFADLSELMDKGSGGRIRSNAKEYEKENPFTSIGMDVGYGFVQSMLPGLKQLGAVNGPRTAFNTAKSGAKVGAAMGGLAGAGSGGDTAGERVERALTGSAAGAVGGAVLTSAVQQVGKLAGRAMESIPWQEIVTPATNATKSIMSAIKASGKSLDRVQRELEADPSKTLADVVPGISSLLKKAQSVSDEAQFDIKGNLAKQASGTAERMQQGVKRSMNSIKDISQDLQSKMKALELGKNADYAAAHAEKVMLTAEVRNILSNPVMKSILSDAQETTSGMIQAGKTPKVTLKPGESPVAFLDQVQRQIGTAINNEKDPARKVLYTELKTKLNDELGKQSPTLASGQDMAEKMSRYSNAKEDAMKWGMQYAKGVNNVDMAQFRAITDPLQKEYAKFGFVQGLNDTYLSNIGNISTQQIKNLKTAISSPDTKELLPSKYATRINKMLDREISFRENAGKISPKIERSEIQDNKNADTLTYGVNKLLGGAVGSAMKLLNKSGMSEAQAISIAKLATTPEGIQMIKSSGKFTDEFMKKAQVINQLSNGLSAATAINLSGVAQPSLKDLAK